MRTGQPKPWHQVVRLKDELRTGELSLAQFAADLHEVTLAQGRRPVYEDPEKFFALTFPTLALRELVKDIAARLAGQSDKAVRQLELTYGGGKTHTLITLYHLFRDPAALPDLPAVDEFREHVGADLPRAFTVALCFDKIDVERGVEGVRGPDGETRTLRHPWSVLAFQLAGADGLRAIHADGLDEERETPPAEPLLVKLIETPGARGLATLILVDEVLMYAREKAGLGAVWRDRIVDFFQALTQAVVKVDRAAIVASLLATDPSKQRGDVGRRLVSDLFDVFLRQREEGVQPVQKEDVAEVLRRRFFEPADIRDPSAFRPHVIGVVRGLAKLDETTAAAKSAAEERFLASFPFHPDLTDVFYSRWTQLEGFQRTRGILRTLATALREAEPWDTAPVVGPSALLAAPGREEVSDAVRELAGVATSEKTEGNKTAWAPLLEAELGKARQVQDELPVLRKGREAEQAVVAVFLHSQPIGHRASTPELVRMAGSAAPDSIELAKGLRRWREISWFLDDEDAPFGTGIPGGGGAGWTETATELPKSWRLGNRPNLRQMHDEACRQRVSGEAVEARLEDTIRSVKLLVEGASAAGASPHMLPASPRDVRDDGTFRYAVLGADAVSDPGKPGPVARRFLDETTGPDRPRVHRNAVVLAVPSRHGLEAARTGVRALLGWEDVQGQLAGHDVDPVQAERLRRRLQDARAQLPDAVRQAYSVVVTVDERNAVHAFRLPAGTGPLFAAIKNDERARIKETPVDAEALLPDGPYDLWREDDEARRVEDLAGAFARFPRLPKVLSPKILLDTVLQGVERGLFVATACPAQPELPHLVARGGGPGVVHRPRARAGPAGAGGAGSARRRPARARRTTGALARELESEGHAARGHGLLRRRPNGADPDGRVRRGAYHSTLLGRGRSRGGGAGGHAGNGVDHERPRLGVERPDPVRRVRRGRRPASEARAARRAGARGGSPARRLAGRQGERDCARSGALPGSGHDAAVGARAREHQGRGGEPLAGGGRGQRSRGLRI